MQLFRLLLQASWSNFAWATLTGLVSGISITGLIALINLTLKGTSLPVSVLAWSFVGLCILALITTAASQMLIGRLVQGVVFDLRVRLNRQILANPLRVLEEAGAPRLLATLTDDVEAVANAAFSVSLLGVNIAMLVGCFLYLARLSVPVFLLVLGLTVIGFPTYQVWIRQGRRFFKLAREEQDRLFTHFRAAIEGSKELKLHHQRRQAFFTEDLQVAAATTQQYQVKALDRFAIGGSWGLLLFFIPIGLLIFGLPWITSISSSVLSGYALVILFMMTPVRGILNTLPILSRANIALAKIESLGLSFHAQSLEPDVILPPQLGIQLNHLELVGVTHSYRGERDGSAFTLGPLDLTFCPGELVFIVGGNGSGKSTLVKLITGLYAPETGTIRINGYPICQEHREWYRQLFSVVFADFYLFERLLGLSRPELEAQAREYLVQLQLEHKVYVQEGALSTTALSQGQRKRLALLTAYLENRPIYVFDEWASDQDPVFKQIFYKQLLPELREQGKLVLVVSHDDHYFHLADRIVKLDYGQLEYDKRFSQEDCRTPH